MNYTSILDDEESIARPMSSHSIEIEVVDTLSKILEQLLAMDSEKQLHVLKELFRNYISKKKKCLFQKIF